MTVETCSKRTFRKQSTMSEIKKRSNGNSLKKTNQTKFDFRAFVQQLVFYYCGKPLGLWFLGATVGPSITNGCHNAQTNRNPSPLGAFLSPTGFQEPTPGAQSNNLTSLSFNDCGDLFETIFQKTVNNVWKQYKKKQWEQFKKRNQTKFDFRAFFQQLVFCYLGEPLGLWFLGAIVGHLSLMGATMPKQIVTLPPWVRSWVRLASKSPRPALKVTI